MKQDTTNHRPDKKPLMQAYNPSYSYVVIEHRMEAGGEPNFLKVDEALSCLGKKIINKELVRDPSTGGKKLIVKMKQQETEELMMTILGSSLIDNFHCYVY